MKVKNLVLLPGFMCDERQWPAAIRSIGPITFDVDTTTADNFADIATSFLRDAPPRFALVGLSMGGILAFEIWRQAHDRISHLALLDTNPYAETHARQTLRLQQIEAVASGRLRELAIDELKPLYLAKAHRDDMSLLQTILDMALDLGPETFRKQSFALKNRVDSVSTLPDIDCPTLVLCGEEDTLCPLPYHQLMAQRIPNARLSVIKDCGHLSTLEQPAAVASELESLLQL